MQKVVLVTGSSGFIGTNLVIKLLEQGDHVIGIDNFSSSEEWKSKQFSNNPNYEFIKFDIVNSLFPVIEESSLLKKTKKIDEIYNLACPASPPRYQKLPLETIGVCTNGLKNVLEIAKKYNSKVLHASTSEVYGDPKIHPQTEDYRGNVNTIGPRSCYDEGKRISETICYEYRGLFDVDVKLIRIFNTYGPYMDPMDGRVVTNFILQALRNEDITIYGDGSQTRSFQYITDLLAGIEKVMATGKEFFGPVNIGNPKEFTIKELAEIILHKIDTKSKIIFKPLPKDDPKQRKPDISVMKDEFEWEPKIQVSEGLDETIKYYEKIVK